MLYVLPKLWFVGVINYFLTEGHVMSDHRLFYCPFSNFFLHLLCLLFLSLLIHRRFLSLLIFFFTFCGFRDKNLGIVQETIRITGEGTREVWREETREKLIKARDLQEEEVWIRCETERGIEREWVKRKK